ncbi:hypothetical protein NL676_027075 [Syzygium grande]|nr:hypothetical protein NL676_027075 [Syzygium grande]
MGIIGKNIRRAPHPFETLTDAGPSTWPTGGRVGGVEDGAVREKRPRSSRVRVTGREEEPKILKSKARPFCVLCLAIRGIKESFSSFSVKKRLEELKKLEPNSGSCLDFLFSSHEVCFAEQSFP